MSEQGLQAAEQRLNEDPERIGAVAKGDTSSIDDLDLTDEEKAMVVAAAEDFPEVTGHMFGSTRMSGFDGKGNDVVTNAKSTAGTGFHIYRNN